MAVDTLGHLLALQVTPSNSDDRTEVAKLAGTVQEATGDAVEWICVERGYSGEIAAEAPCNEDIALCALKFEEAKKSFLLLPQRRVVER